MINSINEDQELKECSNCGELTIEIKYFKSPKYKNIKFAYCEHCEHELKTK